MTTPSAHSAPFGAHLKALRDTQHRTQAEIGHRLHVTADAVRKWESGRSLPDPDAARALDTYLGATGHLYRDYLADAAARRTRNRTATGQDLSAATVLTESAHAAAEFGAWAETTNTGEVAITALHVCVKELARRALTESPATVAIAAAELNATAFTLLRGHHKPGHAQRLYATAGASCALLAWLAGDLGALDLAAVHGATAAQCAQYAEDAEVAAWVAAVESKTLFWNGRFEASALTAARAAALPAPGTVAVMLACQQADAYAKLGDAERTRAALDDARRAADQIREPDSYGGLFSCAPGRAANYAAACRLNIGDAVGSIAAAEQAFAAFRAEDGYGFGTIAQTQISQAFAFGATGRWDAAGAALRPVLDLPAERHLQTLTARLAPMTTVLNQPALRTSRTVAALREEIAAFCETTARKALPASPMEDL